jgi:DNA-binding response OmpR family regulator
VDIGLVWQLPIRVWISRAALTTPRFSKVRLLLVEDEPLIAMLAEAALVEHGAAVTWAHTDQEAYRFLDQDFGGFHALITDINLGEGTTGFDIARYARRLAPKLPIIYMSGEEQGVYAGSCVEDGIFLCKPVSELVLLEAVDRALRCDADEICAEHEFEVAG